MKPSLNHLQVFRCLAFVHVPKEKIKTLNYIGTPGILVGYSIITKQYLVCDVLPKTLPHTRDVVLRDGKGYTAPNAADKAILNKHFKTDVVNNPRHITIEKKPTERQTEVTLDTNVLLEPPNLIKMSSDMAALERSLGDAWKLPAVASCANHAGKENVGTTCAIRSQRCRIQ
jgi:hypothetical protein